MMQILGSVGASAGKGATTVVIGDEECKTFFSPCRSQFGPTEYDRLEHFLVGTDVDFLVVFYGVSFIRNRVQKYPIFNLVGSLGAVICFISSYTTHKLRLNAKIVAKSRFQFTIGPQTT